jgi:hypothetical protein
LAGVNAGLIAAPLNVREARFCGTLNEDVTVMTGPTPDEKANRKRTVKIGLLLGALAVFMYLSIIVKTALLGP